MIFTTTIFFKKFDANLLFTDTNSFTYDIKSKDACEKSFKYKHRFDFSEFQSNFFDPSNKRVIGKMKDEFKGLPSINLLIYLIKIKNALYCF